MVILGDTSGAFHNPLKKTRTFWWLMNFEDRGEYGFATVRCVDFGMNFHYEIITQVENAEISEEDLAMAYKNGHFKVIKREDLV